MNVLDILILVFLVFFFLKGMLQGFLFSLFKFMAYVLGIIIAINFSTLLTKALFSEQAGMLGLFFPILSYGILFCVVVWSVHLFGKFISRRFSVPVLGTINRLAGGILYLFVACFAISAFLWMLGRMEVLSESSRTSSLLFMWIEPIAPWVFDSIGIIFPFLQQTFDQLNGFFRDLAIELGGADA